MTFRLQKLDGYMDGKPSWLTVSKHRSKAEALAALDRMSGRANRANFRIRKTISRKER
jgi:hypothetical protein